MGAFCIYGVSRSICKANASKMVGPFDIELRRSLTAEEWASKRDALTDRMFAATKRRVKISPELDAPQFCRDWLAAGPENVRDTVVMVRGPKIDKHGREVKKDGVVVQTWLEYRAECERLGIEAFA
jgi:hypothetical protein